MRWLVISFALPALGCLQISTGTGAGTGTASGTAADGGAADDSGPIGSGCVEDPQSQVILCQQIDICPNLVVDPGAYPDCGFRLHGASAFDLECVCAGSELCSMGAATTCEEAKQLLDGQSSLLVCAQEGEGRCVPLPGSEADGGGAGSPCASCAAQCGGSPACFQACGC
jgi:hypothetical protein